MVDAITSGSPTGTQTHPEAKARSGTALASDFETFLQMLTAQARFQDPLEPIDSTEYAAQLAQFSMVEQQVQTNETLSAMIAQMGTGTMASLSGWVGMEARAPVTAQFDGSPISVSPHPASVTDQLFLVVKNADGKEVDRRTLPVSTDPYIWDGIDDDGAVLPAGSYSFETESVLNGEVVLTKQAEVYGQVTEAQTVNGEVVLVLQGGHTVPASEVTALRKPL